MQYKWLVLSNTTIATLMAALDTNIVLIALPTIGRQLPNTSATSLLWILLGYSLVTAVVLLNFGRLSDMFGRVRLYVLGFAIFTVGSLLCGFSQTGTELVVFRMVQAIGAGFLFSNSAAIITDAFPPNERGRALGINQVSIVVGAVVGLVLGGVITTTIGWQWIFFINVPIGTIATLRAHRDLHELQKPQREQPIDWVGNVVFAAGLGLLLVALTFGALGQWTIPEAIVGLIAGLALIVSFVFIERRERFPMLDLSLFRNREFTDTAVALFLNALARGAFVFVMVFYLQGPPAYLSPLTAGLILIPVSASLACAGPLSGIFSDRYGRRWFTVAGLAISGGAFVWLATIPSAAPFALLLGPFIMLGAGMGLFASPNRAAMMSAVPPERRGVASGVGTTLMNTAATIGLGLTLVIMSTALPLSVLESILLGSQTSSGPSEAAQFLTGIHAVFVVSAILTGIALVVVLWRGRSTRVAHPVPAAQAPT
ncbi:MAG: MFS transporter [Thermoplasmata archaeon]|jgi:EmrB/QacA subfamily drug resistance transporter